MYLARDKHNKSGVPSYAVRTEGDAGMGNTNFRGIMKKLNGSSAALFSIFIYQGTDRRINKVTSVLRDLIYQICMLSRLQDRVSFSASNFARPSTQPHRKPLSSTHCYYHKTYALRETLLSPVPKGPDDITSVDRASAGQQKLRECIARGEIEQVRTGTLTNRTWIISERYCAGGDGVDSLEGLLHDIWYAYYQMSRVTSHDTPEHDQLVLDILRIQGLGPLTRPVSGNYGIDIARTVQGTLWNDLPFLATDMIDFWIKDFASMSAMQRLNFAAFLAKLASTRANKDRICQIALILFRSTFEETHRALINPLNLEEEDLARDLHDLSIADLLPAACVWIKEVAYTINLLCDVFWNDCPSTVSEGGKAFVESELGKRSPTGFTPWRWMYWLKRLHEIRDEAQEAKNEYIREEAGDTINWMINTAKERNIGILRAYQSGGHELHRDPHLVCLSEEALKARA